MKTALSEVGRDAARALMPLVIAMVIGACADLTGPDRELAQPSSVQVKASLEEPECGVDVDCFECTEEDKDNPDSPCYDGPDNPGEECVGPQCSYTNSVEFTSTPPDSAVVGGTYSVTAIGMWEDDGFPAVVSSLTPETCPYSGGIVTFIAAGTCTIAADQPGGQDVPAATQARQTFEIFADAWPFTGFFAPLSRSQPFNAGSAIPVKFSLGGDRGLDILEEGSPSSVQISCPNGAPTSSPVPTNSAGRSSLSYDVITDTYSYAWATEKAWKNTCRRLTVALTDGSTHSVDVTFR